MAAAAAAEEEFAPILAPNDERVEAFSSQIGRQAGRYISFESTYDPQEGKKRSPFDSGALSLYIL